MEQSDILVSLASLVTVAQWVHTQLLHLMLLPTERTLHQLVLQGISQLVSGRLMAHLMEQPTALELLELMAQREQLWHKTSRKLSPWMLKTEGLTGRISVQTS